MFLLLAAASALVNAVVPLKPIGAIGWLTPDDYPQDALRNNQQGITLFRLTVGMNGKPFRCDVVMPSGVASLDSATCAIMMRRARFQPAHDQYGQPVIATYVSSNSFTLPDDLPAPPVPKPDRLTISVNRLPDGLADPVDVPVFVIVDDKGATERCDTDASPEGRALGSIACQQIMSQWQFKPTIGESGVPVRSLQDFKVTFTTMNDPKPVN